MARIRSAEYKERDRIKKAQWRRDHPDLAKEIAKRCRSKPEHRARNIEASRKWRLENPERAAELNRKWRAMHPERVKELNREWNRRNPERAAAGKARWKANNPEKDLMVKRKSRTRPEYKIARAIRCRLRDAMNRKTKSIPTLQLLGCSVSDLMKHLEAQFQPGMTHENRGPRGWHIDHIFPLSLVDFSDPCEVARATHYTNLRPLWAKDNLRKGNRKK